MIKNSKELIILSIKLTLYSLYFITFFAVFASRNVGLSHVSRTMVITMSTFIVVGILMLQVYGNFRIGEEKSKPIIYSMMLAITITDLITYVQLMIMNTNAANNVSFKFEQLDLFLITFVIQMIMTVVLSYLGNGIFFKLYEPKKTLLIYDQDLDSLKKIKFLLSRYKLQYQVTGLVNSYDDAAFDLIPGNDFVVLLDMDDNRRNKFTEYCYASDTSFAYQASLATIVNSSGVPTVFDDKLMMDVHLQGLSIEQKIAKRLMDIIISSFALVLTSPILIIASLAIKLDDGGAVFFKQKRYTKDAKIFKVFKFRSMKENVANYSAKENDIRITKVGNILRKTRVDELPQLINVLKGEMSLVGPRPEMLDNVHKYENELPEFHYRLKVKGGITGLAQIEGKYNTLPIDKLSLDLVYIENYSIWTDMKLLLRTFMVLFKSDSTEGFEFGDDFVD